MLFLWLFEATTHSVIVWLALLFVAVWMARKAEISGWFGFFGELLFGWVFLAVLLALDYFGAPNWLRSKPTPYTYPSSGADY